MASAPSNATSSSASPPPQSTTKPFRFKHRPHRSPSHRRRSASPPPEIRPSHHRHRRHHHRSHRRPRTPPNDQTSYDDTYPPNASSDYYLHPDTAFRESLFDALADDEGAAFWEGVYGQPIHTYSPYTAKAEEDEEDSKNPRLERMTDEEYVSYVRGKMWEKSHGYIIEERRKREEERRRKRERERVVGEEGRRWRVGVEEALRRGEERRRRGRWRAVWERYVAAWERSRFDEDIGEERRSVRDRIAWPVESGSWKDVAREDVERFFRHAPQASGVVPDLGDVLKKERVRWHPDKIQQRAGGGGIDEGTMKIVTAVFQVVDRLWSDTKGKA